MRFLKTALTAFLFIMPQISLAQQVELSGRLVKKDHRFYLRFEENNKTKELLVHGSNKIHLGQEVWISGRVQGDYLHVDQLVTAKNSLIKGRVGQGIILKGSLDPNSFNGLNFVPENDKATELLGQDSLRVVWPEGHYFSKSNEYVHKVFITGVVVGSALYVADHADSFHILVDKVTVEAGDSVMVTGTLIENEQSEMDYRHHFESTDKNLTYGRGDAYGMNAQGTHVLVDPTDVYVQDKETGKFFPAKFSSEVTATHEGIPANEAIQEEKRMTFIGEMSSAYHLFISDATAHSTDEEKPPEKPKHLRLALYNKNPKPCEATLESKPRPSLTIVPKS